MSTGLNSKERQSLFHSVVRGRLNYVIFCSVLFSIVLIQVFWLILSMFLSEQRLLEELETRARNQVRATVEEAHFEDAAVTQKIGNRLIAIGDIDGATAYDTVGNFVGQFGEKPSLSWITVWNDGLQQLFYPNRCCLDIYLPAAESGLRHSLILRLDASRISTLVWDQLKLQVMASLLTAIFSCLFVVFQLHFLIVHPINKLKKAVFKADDNHSVSKQFSLRWHRGDEIGELSKGIDKLFSDISQVYQEELHAAHRAMQLSNLSILHFNPEGEIVAANPAALRLYSVSSIDELKQDREQFFKFSDLGDENPITPKTVFSRVNGIRTGSALTNKDEIACLISASSLKRKDKTILRHVVMIIPTEKFATQIEDLEKEVEELKAEAMHLKRSQLESGLAHDSFRSLVSAMKPVKKKPEPQAIESEKLVKSTSKYITSAGLKIEIARDAAMPTVMGDEKILKAAFRQAFLIVYLRCKHENPVIMAKAEGYQKGMASFILTDVSQKKGCKPLRIGDSRENWDIPFATLTFLLSKEGGEIISGNTKPGEPNEIKFALSLANYERSSQQAA